MTSKEAREIVQAFIDSQPPSKIEDWTSDPLEQARGYLICDAQWKERVKPLVEALETQLEACGYKDNMCVVCKKGNEALSHFREQMGEE